MRFARFVSPVLVLVAFAMLSRAQDLPKTISGGILNGKAISLPKPVYPPEARAAGTEGAVKVQVLIDENGSIVAANALKEEKLPDAVDVADTMAPLRDSAEQAALNAKFSPTLLNGVPVKVKGVLVYNFSMTASNVVDGGIMNGKAIELPDPIYPAAARAANVSGAVSVKVVIGEDGAIISATAISGHPLLQAAAVDAARQARFSPTFLSNAPVKVTGILTYNFDLPNDQ
jgi:TonB family protein